MKHFIAGEDRRQTNQAGWYTTKRMQAPANITLLTLLAYA